ncbi:MAG TPA: hypothetical protein VLH35_05645 [Candidatus Acidoferrales bacterium]|nr:hypothetical protein [Candidatus Acidoferrales bacterium]
MGTGATENSQSAEKKTKQFNVTDLTCRQKRRIFVSCFSEGGFVAFDKKKVGNQTYYVFIYKR